MNIFLIASNVPYRRDNLSGVTAVHIQTYEIIKALSDAGHKTAFQMIFNKYHPDCLTAEDEQEIDYLKKRGVDILSPFFYAQYASRARRPLAGVIRKMGAVLRPGVCLRHFYPALGLRGEMKKRLDRIKPDLILTIVSPEAEAATYNITGACKAAFQGDIDFRPLSVRIKHCCVFASSLPDLFVKVFAFPFALLWVNKFKRAHVKLMGDFRLIANATASNADFYRKHTRSKISFVGTIWRSPQQQDIQPRKSGFNRPLKIIGHVGNLYATGSTYGLEFLLKRLAPRLRETMSGLDYRIHIIGRGLPVPRLRPFLKQEYVVRRGFVEDLNKELSESDIFLFLNNAGPHLAAYSRHIIAWSMKLCLVCHSNSKKTIPQIVHRENALIGSDPERLAMDIRQALTDKELNLSLRARGYETFRKFFTPGKFTDSIISQAQSVLANQ